MYICMYSYVGAIILYIYVQLWKSSELMSLSCLLSFSVAEIYDLLLGNFRHRLQYY